MVQQYPGLSLISRCVDLWIETICLRALLGKDELPANDNWGVESAPLGTVDVTTLQQTNGFQALANGGVYEEGYIIDSITDNAGNVIYKHESNSVRIYSEATASIMNDMMRSVINAKITTPFKDAISSLNGNLGKADWVGMVYQ